MNSPPSSLIPDEIEIVEVLGRSSQGITKPFRCVGADEHTYFVKGRSAGTRSHLCEWIAGQLAAAFGLELPPFGRARASVLLLPAIPDGSDLGHAAGFASREVPNLAELTWSSVQDVPQNVRRDVLLLDWWLHNNDRTLTSHGGNPNLLWSPSESRLVTIDYNQAFDRDFNVSAFTKLHVFRHDIPGLQQDLYARADYSERLASALAHWDRIQASIPLDWLHHDEEASIATDFDLSASRRLLERYTQDDFWNFSS
ncbi:hypothetical protein EAT51_07800 [Pseudoxanthomonas winnipegensis]|uniref:HipA family kinase n=1 Tax=Pseudoxanthomonas winnipegensis TaxID=2480810 RepID=UPI00102D70B6|nr:HipA family kinase [Pseudoxanthomonas winnipegensis]TAA42166.1 hypothetical protein EAT51_07800 [Pseudoxanthomonas winnipegensis]